MFRINTKQKFFAISILVGVISEACGVFVSVCQHRDDLALILFCLATLLVGVPFYLVRPKTRDAFFSKNDWGIMFLLAALTAPMFTFLSDVLPYNMAGDEPSNLAYTRSAIASGAANFFGPSGYEDWCNFGFIVFGTLSNALGGISIENLRLVNGIIGIAIAMSIYPLYRTTFGLFPAVCAALIAAFNHSLIAQSRMGYHSNIDLLIEVVALTFLIRGMQRRSELDSYLGGVCAGLGYYFYYPARCILPFWTLTVVLLVLGFKSLRSVQALRLYLATVVAFALVVLPTVIAYRNEPAGWLALQTMYSESGLKGQMAHSGTNDPLQAVLSNARAQLTCLTQPAGDVFGLYCNTEYPFCDEVTGLAVWLGIMVLIVDLVRRKREDRVEILGIFSLISFGSLMFVYGFIFILAPNHSRLLMLIPAMGYFALLGLKTLSTVFASRILRSETARVSCIKAITAIFVVIIVCSNLSILGVWLKEGLKGEDRIAQVMRYTATRQGIPNYRWIFVSPIDGGAPSGNCFFPWFNSKDTIQLMHQILGRNETVIVISPQEFCAEMKTGSVAGLPWKGPLTVFVVKHNTPCLQEFVRMHADLLVHDITPNADYEALELPK